MSETAGSGFIPAEDRPQHWDKRVSAAFLRMEGYTQEETAKRVGRSVRTIRNWEQDDTWRFARLEARERWYAEVEDESRLAVRNSVRAGNAAMGLTLLERLDPRLAPPKQRSELTGPNGGPIQTEDVTTLSDAELEARAARLRNRIAGAWPATNGAPPSPNGNGAHG